MITPMALNYARRMYAQTGSKYWKDEIIKMNDELTYDGIWRPIARYIGMFIRSIEVFTDNGKVTLTGDICIDEHGIKHNGKYITAYGCGVVR